MGLAGMTQETIFTVGHSRHALEDFLALLAHHRIACLVDVRSLPGSRRFPHFDREALAAALAARGMAYAWCGRELGGRADDPARYADGRLDYRSRARCPDFRAAIRRLVRDAARQTTAIMCAEKEPLDCHRTLLVARALDEGGVAIRHIHTDGRLETQAQAMARLLTRHGIDPDDLFRPRQEAIAQAVALQAARMARGGGPSRKSPA